MNTPLLINQLQQKKAYPASVSTIQDIVVKQTHISLVFILDEIVYKIKKNINFGFVDYSDLEKRKHFCEEECLLNKRLSQEVYLGVVEIRCDDSNNLYIETSDNSLKLVEYAVKMKRLNEEDSLLHQVNNNVVNDADVMRLSKFVSDFHMNAVNSDEITKEASFANFKFNVEENFIQTEIHMAGDTQIIGEEVFIYLKNNSKKYLDYFEKLILKREQQGLMKDCHGDLRLEHVYLMGEDRKIQIIDCIEFNKRFRYSDPLLDAAFLYMDFLKKGHPDFGCLYKNSYFKCLKSIDVEEENLFQFYAIYRAIVRAKVSAFKAFDENCPDMEKLSCIGSSRLYWHLALDLMRNLNAKNQKKSVILVTGLPGSGKSTIANYIQNLFGEKNCALIRTDFVRKFLGGFNNFEEMIMKKGDKELYTKDFSKKTYSECLNLARQNLTEKNLVVVDGTFNNFEDLMNFENLVEEFEGDINFYIIEVKVFDKSVLESRILERKNDISDANLG
ncbi:hypothetical protein HDU92_002436 [Lobulomyces angularis]|nr:hypothetical protein HDU92_002436 [Lobulomyces angularis]